jgi:hypothetical protein
MNLGRGRKLAVLTALCGVAAVAVASGCGGTEEETTVDDDGQEATLVVEGEPLELGDLSFNVAITRFLNPHDIEDSEYLEGLPPPPLNEDYLAVFMTVANEGDGEVFLPSAGDIEASDIEGRVFEPVESDSLFALELGAPLPAGEEAPVPDSAAATGPVQGSFILFRIPTEAQELRPIELEISAEGEHGIIELDL